MGDILSDASARPSEVN